jgi:hypothetical protein
MVIRTRKMGPIHRLHTWNAALSRRLLLQFRNLVLVRYIVRHEDISEKIAIGRAMKQGLYGRLCSVNRSRSVVIKRQTVESSGKIGFWNICIQSIVVPKRRQCRTHQLSRK